MKQYYTYIYKDPKDGTAIYVGKGKGDRAFKHRSRSENPRLLRLVKKRLKEGFEVRPIINYEFDEKTAYEMEKFWINFYGRFDLGAGTLFNLTDGGEGSPGVVRTEAQKQHLRAMNLGKKDSDETKAKKAKGRGAVINSPASYAKGWETRRNKAKDSNG